MLQKLSGGVREVPDARQAGCSGRQDREAGFTLIELMVVMLIMAILLAIAIPTFLGTRNTANNRATQSTLTNALTTAKAYYTRTQNYAPTGTCGGAAAGNLACLLQQSEPQIKFVAAGGVSTDPNTVVVDEHDFQTNWPITNSTSVVSNAVLLVAYSKSGKCFSILDIETPPATGAVLGETGAGTFYGQVASKGASCSTADVPAAWSSSFQ